MSYCIVLKMGIKKGYKSYTVYLVWIEHKYLNFLNKNYAAIINHNECPMIENVSILTEINDNLRKLEKKLCNFIT